VGCVDAWSWSSERVLGLDDDPHRQSPPPSSHHTTKNTTPQRREDTTESKLLGALQRIRARQAEADKAAAEGDKGLLRGSSQGEAGGWLASVGVNGFAGGRQRHEHEHAKAVAPAPEMEQGRILINNYQNVEYFGDIMVGSNQQVFSVRSVF
jgi:hypothetical protein